MRGHRLVGRHLPVVVDATIHQQRRLVVLTATRRRHQVIVVLDEDRRDVGRQLDLPGRTAEGQDALHIEVSRLGHARIGRSTLRVPHELNLTRGIGARSGERLPQGFRRRARPVDHVEHVAFHVERLVGHERVEGCRACDIGDERIGLALVLVALDRDLRTVAVGRRRDAIQPPLCALHRTHLGRHRLSRQPDGRVPHQTDRAPHARKN